MQHRAKKKFGQNFLQDHFIIEQLVSLIRPTSQDHLVEIGPGLGALTLPLLPYVLKIDAFELDRDLIPLLQQHSLEKGELIIHQQDALLADLSIIAHKFKSLRIVGNLPYNISTPLLFRLFSQKDYIIDMHFMVQKEVADRLAASPGNKQYGRLSVMAQYYCDVDSLLFVPPTAFRPIPKVDSMFIRLIPKQQAIPASDIKMLDIIVKQAFTYRRKTISNALKKLVTREQLIASDIDPQQRPEELSVEKFVILSKLLKTD